MEEGVLVVYGRIAAILMELLNTVMDDGRRGKSQLRLSGQLGCRTAAASSY